MNNTLDYYNKKAESFVEGTVNVEFSKLQNEFASYIKGGGHILDLGCGSGRDSKAFMEMGYQVTPVDGSSEICALTQDYLNVPVICSTFQEYAPECKFDGIWACASLLHLEYDDIQVVMKKMADCVNEGGCFYVSFKYGDFSGERNGRFFTDLTETSFATILESIPSLSIDKQFITEDARPEKTERWLNVFLIKK